MTDGHCPLAAEAMWKLRFRASNQNTFPLMPALLTST